MSRSHVLPCCFVVCISLLFNTFAQLQDQNLQPYLLPTPSPSPSPTPQQQYFAPTPQQYLAPTPQQQNLESPDGELGIFRQDLPPPPQQLEQCSQFNQDDANNQQQEQQQNSLQKSEETQETQCNSQTPMNQNDGVLSPSIISADVEGATSNQTVQQTNGVNLVEEFLDAHNEARRQYNLEPYSWDMKLEAYAREWGYKRCLDCKMIHSYGPYGENLFWGFQEHWTNNEAIQHWVNESQFYDSDQNICAPQKVCGHFTQVVWKDTLRVGCARQKCNNGSVLVICEYDPPGNYLHEHPFKTNI